MWRWALYCSGSEPPALRTNGRRRPIFSRGFPPCLRRQRNGWSHNGFWAIPPVPTMTAAGARFSRISRISRAFGIFAALAQMRSWMIGLTAYDQRLLHAGLLRHFDAGTPEEQTRIAASVMQCLTSGDAMLHHWASDLLTYPTLFAAAVSQDPTLADRLTPSARWFVLRQPPQSPSAASPPGGKDCASFCAMLTKTKGCAGSCPRKNR